jgi:hypothetical protein
MPTRRTLVVALATIMLCSVAVQADTQPPLIIERTIALKNVTGRIDHLAVDLARKRIFVAELGNGTVDVIDLPSGNTVHRIDHLNQPQGLAFAPAADTLAVANAGDGSVRLFHGGHLDPAGVIDLKDDADNIRLDPRTGNLIVGYGSGGLAVIDPAKPALLSRIPLVAHPEGFQLDPDRSRAFINLPDAHQITVVDLHAARQVGTWQIPNFRANFPMALDIPRASAAVVFRDPPHLVIFNIDTGKPLTVLPACGDADDVFFDTRRDRIYASCGAGSVNIWQHSASGWDPIDAVKTAPGARTALFVPALDRLFVAARAGYFGGNRDAAILVIRPVD